MKSLYNVCVNCCYLVHKHSLEVSVRGDIYLHIIAELIALLQPHERYCWFQQNGTWARTFVQRNCALSLTIGSSQLIYGLQDRQISAP